MIVIREGSKEDCPAVLSLMLAAFAQYRDWLEPESGVFRETAVTLQTKLQNETLLLAYDQDQLVGCLFYKPKGCGLYFGRLSVLPAYQGRGIARQLILAVEHIAHSRSCDFVTLSVRIVLEENIRFFASLGYEIVDTGTHDGYVEPTYYKLKKYLHDA
jgi:ribosomal protein S18 acetylase RimI-like enzyme